MGWVHLHVRTWMNPVEIRNVATDRFVAHLSTFVQNFRAGHTYECTSSSCLGNSWMETAETCMRLEIHYLSILQRLMPGYTHKCAAPLPSISRNAMKFSAWSGDHKLCIINRVGYLLKKTCNYTQLKTCIRFHSFIAQNMTS